MFKVGDDLSASAKVLIDKIATGTDESAGLWARSSNSLLLSVRVANWRTQATFDPKGLETFTAAVAKANAMLAKIEARRRLDFGRANRSAEDRIGCIQQMGAELYHAARTKPRSLHQSDRSPNIARWKRPPSRSGSRRRASSTKPELRLLRRLASTVFNQEIIAGLVLLIGGLIAFFIARSISNPIQALTKSDAGARGRQFRRRPAGAQAQGRGRQHRQSRRGLQGEGCRKRDARSRREARAGPARRRRTRRRHGQNGRRVPVGVGSIVQAAVAGDFSKRVVLDGKTGLVLNIGTLINTLCDNVGNGARRSRRACCLRLPRAISTQPHHRRLSRQFRRLKNNANKTAERIGKTIARSSWRPTRSPAPRRKSLPAPPICRSAPRSRPRASNRPRPRWRKSRRR